MQMLKKIAWQSLLQTTQQ